jgi:hypothetical protein
MEPLSHLLPTTKHLQIDTWLMDGAVMEITLHVTWTQPLGHCPTYAFPTRRIHSHYTRVLTYLPWGGVSVGVQLRV